MDSVSSSGREDGGTCTPAPTPISNKNAAHYTTLTFDQLSQTKHVSPRCTVFFCGRIVLSPPKATQDFKIRATCVRVIGNVANPICYPVQKGTEKKMVSLRALPFYCFCAQASQSVFRIRSKLNLAVHLFMDQGDVQVTDPTIAPKVR